MFVRLLTDSNDFCWNKCHRDAFNSDFSGAANVYRVRVRLIFLSSNCRQLARRITVVFGTPSKTFFARTDELLQYPFRTVALPFGYGKGWSLASPPNRFHADVPDVRQNELF